MMTSFKWVDPAAIPPRSLSLSSAMTPGFRGHDGTFEPDPAGAVWLEYPQYSFFDDYIDTVFWCPTSGELATLHRRAFALNEALIDNPATYALEGRLDIYASVGRWITADRRGIVVLDWRQAFERLRDAPRIRIDEALVSDYQRYMVPPRVPDVVVRRDRKRSA